MAGKADFFTASDGHKLCFETWTAADAKASIFFLHGVHESSDTLTAHRLAAAFSKQGFDFHCLEHHAHGRSSGTRALVEGFDLIKRHQLEFITQTCGRRNGTRFAVVGHSMGGAAAVYIGEELKSTFGSAFIGEVLLAPSITCAVPNVVVVSALRAVSYFWPSAPLGPPEHPSEYDTGSGLHLNFDGYMRLQTAKMFVDLSKVVMITNLVTSYINVPPCFRRRQIPGLIRENGLWTFRCW